MERKTYYKYNPKQLEDTLSGVLKHLTSGPKDLERINKLERIYTILNKYQKLYGIEIDKRLKAMEE